jgi:hypothetical protein
VEWYQVLVQLLAPLLVMALELLAVLEWVLLVELELVQAEALAEWG